MAKSGKQLWLNLSFHFLKTFFFNAVANMAAMHKIELNLWKDEMSYGWWRYLLYGY